MKLKRANVTELKREERAFKKRQERNARNRKKYREKHPPRKSKNSTEILQLFKLCEDIEKKQLFLRVFSQVS